MLGWGWWFGLGLHVTAAKRIVSANSNKRGLVARVRTGCVVEIGVRWGDGVICLVVGFRRVDDVVSKKGAGEEDCVWKCRYSDVEYERVWFSGMIGWVWDLARGDRMV